MTTAQVAERILFVSVICLLLRRNRDHNMMQYIVYIGILYIFFLCSGIAFLCLRTLLRNGYTIAEYLSLSVAGGLIPLFGAIGLIWLLDLFLKVKINLITVLEILLVVIVLVVLQLLFFDGLGPISEKSQFSLYPWPSLWRQSDSQG